MPIITRSGDRHRHQTPFFSIKFIVGFVMGFVMGFILNHILHLLTKLPSVSPPINQVKRAESIPTTNNPPPPTSTQGIYPLLRDFQCGHANMATPRALQKTSAGGRSRIVVDVGLFSGEETLDAVEAGFVVFGFELNAGSIPVIRENARKRNIIDRVHFVEFVYDETTKGPVAKELPRPPEDGRGYAYIYNAGLSDESGSIAKNNQHNAVASVGGGVDTKWSPDRVPILRLDQSLPDWVTQIFFLKIDTQGFEWKVLNGAEKYLLSNRVQYAQYEFSPKLMQTANSGDPLRLLKYMTSMGAICFDMLLDDGDGEHHVITRPSTPLERYLNSLMSGLNSTHRSAVGGLNYTHDPIGPWDDILCWFPGATG